MKINIEKVSSFCDVQNRVAPNAIYFSDDSNNAYYMVVIDEIPKIGLSFTDFGISPVFLQNNQTGLLYIGFGRKIVVIETINLIRIAEYETSSAVFDLFLSNDTNIVVLACETSVYLFVNDKEIDSMEFPDMIKACNLTDEVIHLKLDHGESYEISLSRYVNNNKEENLKKS